MTPEQEERDGEDARRWLESPVYKRAWTKVEAAIVAKIKNVATPDDEVLECKHYLRLMDRVRRDIEQVATTGTMVAMKQNEKRSFAERIFGGLP